MIAMKCPSSCTNDAHYMDPIIESIDHNGALSCINFRAQCTPSNFSAGKIYIEYQISGRTGFARCGRLRATSFRTRP
jgi:hypothetical protein